MRSKGYKCYNYWCKGRIGDSPLCGEPGDIALSCQDRIVSTETNADRIRAISDDELAKFLCNIRSKRVTRYSCEGCVAEKFCHDGHNGMTDWLRQPAEEGTDDE